MADWDDEYRAQYMDDSAGPDACDDDDEDVCADCGRGISGEDVCGVCGATMCFGCFEMGAGVCKGPHRKG